MGIGGGIFLIALGAILAFAVEADDIGWLDISVAGWILMLAGLAVAIISWVFWSRSRRAVRDYYNDDDIEPQNSRSVAV